MTYPGIDVIATEFTVSAVPPDSQDADAFSIKVEWRGGDLWAVTRGRRCLNSAGEWEYEPSPSSREDDFIERCRFDREEAIDRAVAAAPHITVNGFTVADAIRMHAERTQP